MSSDNRFYVGCAIYLAFIFVALGGAVYAAGREGKRPRDYLDDGFVRFCVLAWPVGLMIVCFIGMGMLGEKGLDRFLSSCSRFVRWISAPWRWAYSYGQRHRDNEQEQLPKAKAQEKKARR